MPGKWTSEPPVEPGYYWVCRGGWREVLCVQSEASGKLAIIFYDDDARIPVSQYPLLWWSEPIAAPEPPA